GCQIFGGSRSEPVRRVREILMSCPRLRQFGVKRLCEAVKLALWSVEIGVTGRRRESGSPRVSRLSPLPQLVQRELLLSPLISVGRPVARERLPAVVCQTLNCVGPDLDRV